jgi:hypothetical protein
MKKMGELERMESPREKNNREGFENNFNGDS